LASANSNLLALIKSENGNHFGSCGDTSLLGARSGETVLRGTCVAAHWWCGIKRLQGNEEISGYSREKLLESNRCHAVRLLQY
jgi:hypothetical protein